MNVTTAPSFQLSGSFLLFKLILRSTFSHFEQSKRQERASKKAIVPLTRPTSHRIPHFLPDLLSRVLFRIIQFRYFIH